MSNEIKVGLLAIVAIALSFWGYKFIMGKNVLLKSNTYKVYYPTVDRMQVGTQVFINGVEVGSVANVRLLDDVDRTVEVALDLETGIRIPKDTRAVIISTGVMGGKAVMLEYDKPCTSDEDCAKTGDTIEGTTMGMLASMVGEETMQEYVNILKKGLKEVVDTLNRVLIEDTDSPLGNSLRNMESALANLNSATGQVDVLLRSSSASIKGTLSNLDAITANFKQNEQKVNSILSNADSLSSQLVAADLEQTLREVDKTIAELRSTLQSADQALTGVSEVVGGINSGEGTLGKLMQDEALYQNLRELSHRADSLLNDFQDRPYRYMPLKSRRKVRKYDRRDAGLEN